MMQLDKEDLKAWAEAEENLCDKFHLDLEELIKILDYCFGGRNKNTGRKFSYYEYCYSLLDVKQKELERAIRRTIPKLPELDKLAVLREETDELDIDFVHGADSVVFKNKDGTYRQLETLNEEEGEEDEQTI